MNVKNALKNLTLFERLLWGGSVAAVLISYFAFRSGGWLSLAGSIVGATALIFVAKGNVLGQMLTIVFGVIYAIVSYQCRYYGEMITYLGMTLPSALAATISWIRNPYRENEVKVRAMKKYDIIILGVLAALVTALFYFILRYFNTANLAWSTVSIATSFMASSLTMLRSQYYALWYALNDVVLIVLWVLATVSSIEFLPMVVCFLVFLANDLYGFFYWSRMARRQTKQEG